MWIISDSQKQGHQVHVYTTSYRTSNRIRWTLRYYGIRVDRIVNQKENSVRLKEMRVYASKYPRAFDFDLHMMIQKAWEWKAKSIILKPLLLTQKMRIGSLLLNKN
ncbi:hypothetical protein [Myroides odoratus]|uniref:hypothetical protein n=1 Tax=Myroides odoratus TaxID=256 RepID=UPI0039B00237